MSVDQPLARRRLRPAERAHQLEEAATRMFARQGYAATSVEDIVAAAGVTKPMLYRHYESKQELCIALLERYREELIGVTLSAAQVEPSDAPLAPLDSVALRARLTRMIDAWLGWVQAHPDAARLLFTPLRGDEEVQRTQDELFARQQATQAALLREFLPDLPPAEIEPLAEITRAGFAAIALWWLKHPDQPRQVARTALVTMGQGIVMVGAHQLPDRRTDRGTQQDLV